MNKNIDKKLEYKKYAAQEIVFFFVNEPTLHSFIQITF